MTAPSVTIGDWSSTGVDTDGVTWKLTDLTGFEDASPVRVNFTPRPGDDGSFDGPVFDDVRVITISGIAVSSDRLSRAAAKKSLARAARACKLGTDLVGHFDDGDYTVHVKRSTDWKVSPLGPLGFQYQAVVSCPDPFKYGPTSTVSTSLPSAGASGLTFPLFDATDKLEFGATGAPGQVVVTNDGTADAWPMFVVTAQILGGFSLVDIATSRQITFAADVPTGAVLTIDSATGRADLNGTDFTGELTVSNFWAVAPESSSTVQFTATLGSGGQTGQLSASIAPTYE